MFTFNSLEDTTLRLCRVPSPTGGESLLCQGLRETLSSMVGAQRVMQVKNSLLVTTPNPEHLPRVILAGHLDVVNVKHDSEPRIEGDRLYGPGASDMKGGLAVMLHLLREAECGRRLRYAPQYIFYSREEGPYQDNELAPLLIERSEELAGAEVAICLEPSDNELQLGCVGGIHATVTFKGRSAHSARPWQGENAILKAAEFLQRLKERLLQRVTIDDLPYVGAMTPTLAKGGRGRNVVPDAFELNINVRFVPGQTPADAIRELTEMVRGEADIAITDECPAALPHRDNPHVQALLAAGATGPTSKQAWTDVAQFGLHGYRAINFGPGTSAQAHQPNEYLEVSKLQRGYEIFERWLFA